MPTKVGSEVLIEREILKGDWTKKSIKTHSTNEESSIYFVTRRQPPQRLGESGEIGKAIFQSYNTLRSPLHAYQQSIRLGNSELGHVLQFEIEGNGNPWGALGLNSPDLALASGSIQRGVIEFANTRIPIEIPMCQLNELLEVGPTHHLIRSVPNSSSPSGVFEIYPINDDKDSIGTDRLIWNADAKKQNSLLSIATHKGVPKGNTSLEELNSIRQSSNTLFYSKNMRWTSEKILSTVTQNPILGGRSWLSLGHQDQRVQFAFCLWSNSTFGMLIHWSIGQRTQTGRSTTQVSAIKAIPSPDFRQLSDKQLELAKCRLTQFQSKSLSPACQAHVYEVRKQLDDAIIEILGLPDEAKLAIDQLQFLWCSEPSVHGNNKQALKKWKKINGYKM